MAREKTPTPLPRRPQADGVSPDRSRRPAVAGARRPNVQPKSANRGYSFALIAASVVLVAAAGAAADWLFVRQGSEVTRSAQASMPAVPPTPAATEPVAEVARAENEPAVPKEVAANVPAVAVTPPAPAPAPAPKAAAPSKPKPAAPPAKPARAAAPPAKPRPQSAPREAVPAPAPALSASAAPAPVSAPAAREAAATSAAASEKAAPVGPFFETKDVNESPRVAGRVEPRLPAELKARKIHEVVIVRALVSQSGHPSRVSVLRKSKAGPQLDDVVVAAVNQWTFAPAKKKGEPVSCWLNFGVQIGAAD